MVRLLANWAAALDPVQLARHAGFAALDPWQVEVLQSVAPRILLNCARQSGKSTVTALLALHTALYHAPALVLMVSATQRQSGELFRKAAGAWRALGMPVDATSASALQLELANGSRIVALPGREGTIRSYSHVALLLLDEASRIEDETYAAVRPMLAVSGGRMVALSTPFGARGWWFEAWRGSGLGDANGPLVSGDGWARWRVPAQECPRISAEFLESERQQMGAWWYEQEYLATFLDAQTAAFRAQDIERAFSEDYETWDLPDLLGRNVHPPAAPALEPEPAPISSTPARALTETGDPLGLGAHLGAVLAGRRPPRATSALSDDDYFERYGRWPDPARR